MNAPIADARYRTATARIVRPNRWPIAYVLAWFAVLGVLGALSDYYRSAMGAFMATLVLGPLSFLMGHQSGRAAAGDRTGTSVLEASREGVFVDGRLVIPRGTIDNGALVPDPSEGGALVLLGRKDQLNHAHTVHARDAAEAQAILRALGLDVSHATLVHREAGWFPYGRGPTMALGGAFALGVLTFIPLLLALHGSALGAVPAALSMTAFFGTMWATRSHVVVGADGVLIRWLRFERYCAFADVARVERTGRGVVLHKRDGTRFNVVIDAALQPGSPAAQMDRDKVTGRILEAFAAQQAGLDERGDLAPAALARNDRPVAEWVESLRNVLAATTHRAAAVMPEELWTLLANPEAPPASRAAAAVALAPTLDEPGRERLRVTAASTASPQLRVVLERAASEGEPGEIEHALEALAPRGDTAARRD